MIVAGTGHRPDKLGGYGDDVEARLVTLARSALRCIAPTHVISGGALGWDSALAWAALAEGIPYTVAIPFAGQELRWPFRSQVRYRAMVRDAAKTIIVCEGGYAAWKMQRRNEWMVDHCEALLALWNGSAGGTSNCVAYAQAKSVPIINVWTEWLDNANRLPE